MVARFLSGIELSRRFYVEVVRPLLDQHEADLTHSAALLGWGSDVLGFDSPRSTDHNWGPRCQIFVGPGDASRAARIRQMLEVELPETFLGWPSRFPDVTAADQRARHWVDVAVLGEWLSSRLGFDPRAGVGLLDWLATPTQALAEVTGGAVFHDGLDSAGRHDPPGGLRAARAALSWYPDDIWRYILACQWRRISQEEAFPGRCAEARDDLGSAVVATRLVRDLMRLTLLMRRVYPPYSKWLGTAFARLSSAGDLQQLLRDAISATTWPDRERALCGAYTEVARMHNDLAITEPADVTVRRFYDRPYLVIDAGRFEKALLATISDPEVSQLSRVGAIDQFVDSTDAAGDLRLLRAWIAPQLAMAGRQ